MKTSEEREFMNLVRAVIGKGPIPYTSGSGSENAARKYGPSFSHHLDGFFGDGNRHVRPRQSGGGHTPGRVGDTVGSLSPRKINWDWT
jgi:hypothetical protein